jgi:hypothetical protein
MPMEASKADSHGHITPWPPRTPARLIRASPRRASPAPDIDPPCWTSNADEGFRLTA